MKHSNIPVLLLIIFYNFSLLKGNYNTVFISDETKKDSLKITERSKRLSDGELNKLYSNKKLGSFVEDGKTYFRLFAPMAKEVKLLTFNQPEETEGASYSMTPDSDGVWEAVLNGEHYGLFYGFNVNGDSAYSKNTVCLDPYAKAVASFNTYMGARRAIVLKDDYNWENDTFIEKDWRDLIIYEMHIRDLTAHKSSGAASPGTYMGLTEKGIKGGIEYIKSLGVNTVELLPSQEFANIEVPFKREFENRYNTWNPYERNHWGYMTASFFAPDAYYTENELKWNSWSGKDAKQVTAFKDMVKAFHKEGIAVVMDVVYNHISEYELGNLKEIDPKYYFRLDSRGRYVAESGCGNDFKTERLMARRMIIESILYWMKQYHIDGFRFDLGKLLDWETIEEILYEARKVNPSVFIVCEPWGGGYDPQGFSLRGWASWNDQIRNGIKGENPHNGLGWIFGKWYGNNNIQRIKSYVNGTLVRDSLGLFQKKEHSLNYLESHDGYTLGDFIRIGTGEHSEDKIIKDVDKHTALSPFQLKLNKLAALFLLSSQGPVMISEGQEFARSKVIPFDIEVKDSLKGRIDHNSYNKDNETNYLNFKHAEINHELVDYYKGLIDLRKKYKAFRRADYESISFIEPYHHPFALGYKLNFENDQFMVLFNADNHSDARFDLPDGKWNVLVDPKKAGVEPQRTVEHRIVLSPKDGYILIKAN
ncbi:MAG: alpha-amylase family glycosyl hydrolase [Bacteroidota bacterium]|nr:alpha-amylase family glycosyl hydrolase [Bacteroidota bacterium]